jgi:hypothetical protein
MGRRLTVNIGIRSCFLVSGRLGCWEDSALCCARQARRSRRSDDPVTQITFEVGFQTKSNCNREFLRVTSKSPSVWCAENGPGRAEAQQRLPPMHTRPGGI